VRYSLIQVTFLQPIQERLLEVDAVMLAQADQHHPDLGAAMEHLL